MSIFQSYVYSSDFDIICLTETWLSESIFDQEILPTNYQIYRKDRPSRGGGVLIAIKSTNISVSAISPDLLNSTLEIITVRLNLHNPITLSCVYLPTSQNDSYINVIISNLTEVIQSNQSTDIIVVGDFNFPDIQWDTLSTTSTSSRAFCDFIFDNSLVQLINQLIITHVKGNILDLVLSNSNEYISNLTIAPVNDWTMYMSDHFAITFQLSQLIHQTPATIPKYVYDFPKANYDAIQSYLFDFDYSLCSQSQDVEFIWHTIKNSI